MLFLGVMAFVAFKMLKRRKESRSDDDYHRMDSGEDPRQRRVNSTDKNKTAIVPAKDSPKQEAKQEEGDSDGRESLPSTTML